MTKNSTAFQMSLSSATKHMAWWKLKTRLRTSFCHGSKTKVPLALIRNIIAELWNWVPVQLMNFPGTPTNSYTCCCMLPIYYPNPVILSIKVYPVSPRNMAKAIVCQHNITAFKEQSTTVIFKMSLMVLNSC